MCIKKFFIRLICGLIPIAKKRRQLRKYLMGAPYDLRLFHVSAQHHANVGDWILADSLRDTVSHVFNKKIYWIKQHVHMPVDEKVIRKINRCDALIIGGGGLFLKDTNPNNISGWQWPCPIDLLKKIRVPIIVMAVGYNRFRNQDDFDNVFFENVSELIKKSAFFGLRNNGSIKSIRKSLPKTLSDKVEYFPCTTTVLSKIYDVKKTNNSRPIIGLNMAFDRSDKRYGENICVYLDRVLKAIKKLSKKADIWYYVHCENDAIFATMLQSAGVNVKVFSLNYVNYSMSEYLDLYSVPDLVIGMRGHAQMIPFGCNTPIISLVSHDKMKWFLDDINHQEYGVEINDPELDTKLYEMANKILSNKKKVVEELVTSQNKLYETTVNKLTKILKIIEEKNNG